MLEEVIPHLLIFCSIGFSLLLWIASWGDRTSAEQGEILKRAIENREPEKVTSLMIFVVQGRFLFYIFLFGSVLFLTSSLGVLIYYEIQDFILARFSYYLSIYTVGLVLIAIVSNAIGSFIRAAWVRDNIKLNLILKETTIK